MTGRNHGLTLRKKKFVSEYLSNGGNAAAAVRAAGYSTNHASHQGWLLVNRDEAVKAELERAHQELADRTDYRTEAAMEELGEVIAFARETKNATAMARAVELRMRMAGLLIEKSEINIGGQVDIVGALLEGRQRAGLPLDTADADVLDGEYVVSEIGQVDGESQPGTNTDPVDIFS